MADNIELPPHGKLPRNANQREVMRYAEEYARTAILADRARQAPAPVEAIAAAEALEAARASIRAEFGLHFPLRKPELSAEQQGLFQKFIVRRTDGRDEPGCKHENCEYFVLDVSHDPHAKAALEAYADAVEATHGPLAADLRSRYGLSSPAPVEVSSLAKEAKEAAREHAGAVFGASGVDRCCATWDALVAAVDRLASMASTPASEVPAGLPIGWICERTALVKLRDKVDELPLHPHKRAAVRDWVDAAIAETEAQARAAVADTAPDVCEHGIRRPHECDQCADAATPASPATEGEAVAWKRLKQIAGEEYSDAAASAQHGADNMPDVPEWAALVASLAAPIEAEAHPPERDCDCKDCTRYFEGNPISASDGAIYEAEAQKAVALNPHVIYDCLTRDAKKRTSWESVEDVLIAIRTRHGTLYAAPTSSASTENKTK